MREQFTWYLFTALNASDGRPVNTNAPNEKQNNWIDLAPESEQSKRATGLKAPLNFGPDPSPNQPLTWVSAGSRVTAFNINVEGFRLEVVCAAHI